MEKLVLDDNKCLGCGNCVATAPESFGWGEGTAKVINEEVTEAAKNAKDCCPTGAIEIKED